MMRLMKKYVMIVFAAAIFIVGAGLIAWNRTPTAPVILTPLGTPFTPPPKEESTATTTQVGKIDEHVIIDDTLRSVNFCDTTYQARQVFVDGVDVAPRIAVLLASSSALNQAICANATYGVPPGGTLAITLGPVETSGQNIYFGHFEAFRVDFLTGSISASKSEEGSSTVIGFLKK